MGRVGFAPTVGFLNFLGAGTELVRTNVSLDRLLHKRGIRHLTSVENRWPGVTPQSEITWPGGRDIAEVRWPGVLEPVLATWTYGKHICSKNQLNA